MLKRLSVNVLTAAIAAMIAVPPMLASTGAYAQAVVGQPRAFDMPQVASPTIDKLRSEYKRPNVIKFPKDNPYTPEKAELGKKLFFDTRLSSGNLLSCASCHSPAFGWGDGQPTGVGNHMKKLGRRSPSIINAAYGQVFMWDGRAGTLEEQALGPIQADVEMGMPLPELLSKLNAIPEYKRLFEVVFPGKGITSDGVAKAIATYERTVVSARSPFDAWVEGDAKAISEEAKNGFLLFNTKAQCSSCHSGWNFTDDSFHDIGLKSEDIGRGKFLIGISKAQQAFKTPGLREISLRGPYMHDGSVPTLEAVMEHYDHAGVSRDSRSDLIKPLGLSAKEKRDLVEFTKTLTATSSPTTMPVLPR